MGYGQAVCGIALALILSGCATTPTRGADDPLKPINKKIFIFNKHVDRVLLKPTAQAYVGLTPLPLRRGVSDVFANLDDIGVIINESLQGRPLPALQETARFIVNSTLGLLGVIDVATPMGLTAHNADFGETLAVWGVRSGPYLVLPLFGPSDVRDAIGLSADIYTDPVTYLRDPSAMWRTYILQTINTRSQYLHQGLLLQIAAGGHEYDFARAAFWQKRRQQIARRRGQH